MHVFDLFQALDIPLCEQMIIELLTGVYVHFKCIEVVLTTIKEREIPATKRIIRKLENTMAHAQRKIIKIVSLNYVFAYLCLKNGTYCGMTLVGCLLTLHMKAVYNSYNFHMV